MRSIAARSAVAYALLVLAPLAARAQVEVSGGRTSVVLDTETLADAAGLELSSVSEEVESPGALPGSVAFPINPRDAAAPLLPTTFRYDPADFLGSFAGTIEHEGSVFFNGDTVEVGNFTIGFDAARAATLGGEASGFFVQSTVGVTAVLFDIRNPSAVEPGPTSLLVRADLLVSPELAGFLGNAALAGADVGDAQVDAVALVEIAGGRTSVLLDTDALESAAGLALSSVSAEVLVPGEFPGSVAFPINARDAAPPLRPTSFAYDPSDFLSSFSGTIEHVGSVFFNGDTVEVGDFTIGFAADRVGTLGGEASGFFVASTAGIPAILFDVRNPSALEATPTGLRLTADLLVSPELAGFLSNAALSGADVGDAQVNGFPSIPVEISRGRTSVALDTATLEAAAGLELVGVSPGVIAPGALADSVAFPINPRDAMPPMLPTTFAFDPTDFLGTFSGTIEHTGSVFFAGEPQIEVGDFTIGFDAARAGTLGGEASGFFVESTTGVEAILFDVAAPSRLVPDANGVEIEADLLVSPELAGFLLAEGLASSDLTGADVGDAKVEAVPEPGAAALALAALGTLAGLSRRRAT